MDRSDIAQREATQAAEEALEAQRLAEKQRQWNANWGKGVPGVAPPAGKLAPGERIVRPEDLDRGA